MLENETKEQKASRLGNNIRNKEVRNTENKAHKAPKPKMLKLMKCVEPKIRNRRPQDLRSKKNKEASKPRTRTKNN